MPRTARSTPGPQPHNTEPRKGPRVPATTHPRPTILSHRHPHPTHSRIHSCPFVTFVVQNPHPNPVPYGRPVRSRGAAKHARHPRFSLSTPAPGIADFPARVHPLTLPHIPLNVTFRSRKSRGVAVPVTVAVTVVVPATGVLGWAVKVTVVPAASVTPLSLKVVRSFDHR